MQENRNQRIVAMINIPTNGFETICDAIAHWAALTPSAPAIMAPDRGVLSYQALLRVTDEVAAAIERAGVKRGDHVAVVLPNGPEMAVAALATMRNATCAPLNPGFKRDEFLFCLQDLRVSAVLLAHDERGPIRAAANELNVQTIELMCDQAWPAGQVEIAHERTVLHTMPPGGDDAAIVLHTSGTTSRPKIVPLTQRNLSCSARNVARTLRLGPSDRCLNLMPLFHIHGLVANLFASLYAGGSVACAPGYQNGKFLCWVNELHATWYSAVPAMHQAVLAELTNLPPRTPQRPLRFARSSSAALPRQVMRDLEATLGAPVIEAYGMTEAAHQMASNPLPPAARKAGSVGLAAGPQVGILDQEHQLVESGVHGEIVIRGDNVMPGYLSNPTANQEAFPNGWFRTGDQGYLDAEGYLYITGRIKEIINRGGEKIMPREVDEALLEHPCVQEAVAFAIKHPTLGEDVAAAVVLKRNAQTSAEEIRQHLFGRIAGHKIPSQVLLLDEIPKGATGKIQRAGLSEKLAQFLKSDFVAPQGEVETKIASIFSSVLGLPPVGAADNFFALGGDSLRGTQVITRIRTEFGVSVPVVSLFRFPSVSLCAKEIQRLRAESESQELLRLLDEIESLSEEEVKDRLAQNPAPSEPNSPP